MYVSNKFKKMCKEAVLARLSSMLDEKLQSL
jgi:hypothetical protein